MNNFNLLDVYYERIDFKQNKTNNRQQITLKINHKYEFMKSNDFKSVKLVVRTSVLDSEGRLYLDLDTVAIFGVNNEIDINNQEMQRELVSMAWPYVRQEIQVITIQPEIMPIILPINPQIKQPESQDMYA